MLFTTQVFLFVFLPICLAAYYFILFLQKRSKAGAFLQKIRAADLVLIAAGCSFYLWSCFDDLFRLLAYIIVIWLAGHFIGKRRDSGTADAAHASGVILAAGIAFAVFVLVHFKYIGTLTEVWNFFFKDSRTHDPVAAPLGISFITFSAISYLADIKTGKARPGSLLDCLLYITFFPKVVSGPITLWRDFYGFIDSRTVTLDGISYGVSRVMIGFAKKLILADTFGSALAAMDEAVDVPTAWFAALLYMLQIYFDFSGYSDIAIGLSGMLGFPMKENFNFPYLSRSITEFWHRWHISLGTWFREYIYIPLGGSRQGKKRTVLNVLTVFLLTGIWHGAGLGYFLWGMINGVCNVIEKLIGEKKFYKKTPGLVKWLFTTLITFFSWELFRFGKLSLFNDQLMIMFGLKRFTAIPYTWRYYLDAQIVTLAVIGALGATVWGLPKIRNAYLKFTGTKTGYLINQLVFVLLFIISVMFMVSSQYSPFIYFRY